MMNDFFIKQNDNHMISLLAAQRQIYTSVKKKIAFNFVLTVICPVIFSLILLVLNFFAFPIAWVRAILVVFTIVSLVIAHFQVKEISKSKKLAANIQEKYDTSLYEMEWNDIACEKPHESIICENSKQYRNQNGDGDLINWYLNEKVELPRVLMVLLCQTKNIGWDVSLKKITNKLLLVVTSIVSLIYLAFFFGATLIDFLIAASVLLPLFIFCYKYVTDNNKSIDSMSGLQKKIEDKLDNIITEKKASLIALTKMSRSLQDEIYRYRAMGNPAPDFLHKNYRPKDEKRYDEIFESYKDKLVNVRINK